MKQDMNFGKVEWKPIWELLDMMHGVQLFMETYLPMSQGGTIQKQ